MPDFLSIVKTDDAHRISLYGEIGRWQDIDEKKFASEMEQVPADGNLEIYINSEGGDVFTAIAIYRQIARHKGNVKIFVDGVAASAASIIACAPGARVVMPVGSMMMIHLPSTIADGNAEELRRVASALDSIGMSLVDIYVAKTGLQKSEVEKMMAEETWLSPAEALKFGFCDEVDYDFIVKSQSCVAKKKIFDESQVKKMADDAYAQGRLDGIEAERDRIKALENLQSRGFEKVIARAKFDSFDTPEAVAVEICQMMRQKSADEVQSRSEQYAARVEDANEIFVDTSANAGLVEEKVEKLQKAIQDAQKDIAAGYNA